MAISTNGTVLARLAGGLYNTTLSNATYAEVNAVVKTAADINTLANDLYARDFASKTDLSVANTGGGQDNAQNAITASGQTTGQGGSANNARPGGNRSRLDLLVRHEQVVSAEVLGKTIAGQLTAWLRLAKSRDQQVYSELLGDLKTSTLRQDAGLAFWWPVAQNWSAGLNLEATSQRSNNALFNLKNSALYLGLRWAKD